MKNIVLSSALFVCSSPVLNAAEIQNNVSCGSAEMNCDGKSLSIYYWQDQTGVAVDR